MKLAGIVLLMFVVGMASVEAGPMRKRFLLHEIQHAINSVGDFFSDTYNSAKHAFQSLVSDISFDDAVHAMTSLIHTDTTVSACAATCRGSASFILGDDAKDASQLCTPVCEGALAKLEEMAG